MKKKVALPFRKVELDLIYGEGMFKIHETIDIGGKLGILEKSGYSYCTEKLGHGKENVKKYLKDNLAMAVKVVKKIIEASLQAKKISCIISSGVK